MANENIVIDLSEHYGDVSITRPEDRVTILSLLPIFRRNWLSCCLIFLGGFSISVLASFLLTGTASYKATGKLLFQASDAQSELTGIAEELDPLEATGILTNPLNTQASLLTSGFLIEDVISNLALKDENGELLPNRAIRTGLSVEPLPSTDILRISFQSEEPQLSAQVVNELMHLYTEFVEQEQKAEILAAKEFVDEQLPRLEADLDFASRALEQFKSANQVVSLDRQAADLTALLTNLEQQLGEAQVALRSADIRSSELSEQLNIDAKDALNLSTLNDAPSVQEVLQELQAAETELARQRGLYLPKHPTIINLQSQADQLANLLQERINIVLNESAQISLQDLQLGDLKQSLLSDLVQTESERILLETQLAAFSELKREYANQALRFPSLERQQFELELNLENAKRSYNELLQRSQEIKLAEIQIEGSNYVQVIEEARPPQTVVSTFNPIILGFGIASSFILSSVAGVALDRLDTSVKSAGDLAKTLDYPLLGLVPEFDKTTEENLLIARTISSELLDIYRSIYSSLKIVNLDNSVQIIAITSAVHHEGKSEVAANLAFAIAHSRRRVLLIDADLRTPVQHQLWQIPNDAGLSHLLSEKSSLEAAVYQRDPYLSIMPAGLAVAEPSLFFESARMKEMLHEAKASYDYIIFDASPVLTEPDALLLGQVSEGLIFVGWPKYVQKGDVLAASKLIDQAKLNVMGLVVNRTSQHEQRGNRMPFSNTYQTVAHQNGHRSEIQTMSQEEMQHLVFDQELSHSGSNGGGKT